MPGGLFEADTSFPNLEGKSTEQKLKAIESYLYQLLETLRYTLNNLSQDNMNTAEVTGWLDEIITEPIQAEIGDVETGLTQLGVDVNGIKAQVTDGQGNYTVLNLKSDGLHIGNASGTTTINGTSITTGSITADQIAARTITSAEIKSETITANELHAGAVTAGKISADALNGFDIYGALYHDEDGDADFDITSGSLGAGEYYYRLLFGAHNTSFNNSTFGIEEYMGVGVNDARMRLGGMQIMHTSYGTNAVAATGEWDFSDASLCVMYGTDPPATYFTNHDLTPNPGQVYFKI